MTDTQNTKTRSEAPVAALAFGIIALVTAFVFSTPGFPLIAGVIALLAGLAVIVKAQQAGTGQNWMAITGVILAIVGVFVSLVTYG